MVWRDGVPALRRYWEHVDFDRDAGTGPGGQQSERRQVLPLLMVLLSLEFMPRRRQLPAAMASASASH